MIEKIIGTEFAYCMFFIVGQLTVGAFWDTVTGILVWYMHAMHFEYLHHLVMPSGKLKMDLAYRAGTGTPHRADLLRMGTINVTALMRNWHAIISLDYDILVVSETKVTGAEQKLLTKKLEAHGWICHWSHPLPATTTGMKGRSGGTLILTSKLWQLAESIESMETLAGPTNCRVLRLRAQDNRDGLVVCAYYGHPEARAATQADLACLFSYAHTIEFPMVILGDFNLNPAQLDLFGDEYEVIRHAQQLGIPLDWTFVGPHGSSSPDRIFAVGVFEQKMHNIYIDSDACVPQHRLLAAEYQRTPSTFQVETPLPPICLRSPLDQAVRAQWEELAAAKVAALPSNVDVDTLFREWCRAWEEYLLNSYDGNTHLRQGRGERTIKEQRTLSVTRPVMPKLLARLTNFINLLDKIEQRLKSGAEIEKKDWTKLISSSSAMAHYYGVPSLDMQTTPDAIPLEVVARSRSYYTQVLHEEWLHRQHHRYQEYKQKLMEYGDSNKHISKLVRAEQPEMPIHTEDGVVYSQIDQLTVSAQAWKAFITSDPAVPTSDWRAKFPTRPIRPAMRLRELTGADLRDRVKRMKMASSPGVDSWRVGELRALPPCAFNQLASLYNKMEESGQIPVGLQSSWSSLLPATKPNASPLDRRPIAVLPTLWRLYASTRCAHLQDWAADVLPDNMYAYLRGKSCMDAGVRISNAIDHSQVESSDVFMVSLDASKAFPSASRELLFHIMRKKACPEALIRLVEQFYLHTSTVFRVLGKYIHPGSSPLHRGVYQGCPLSVFAFSCLQVPLLEYLDRYFPDIEAVVYADDLSLWTSDLNLLQLAIPHVLDFYAEAGICINEAKTQFWSLRPTEEVLKVGSNSKKAQSSITILGCTFHAAGIEEDTVTTPYMDKYMAKLNIIAKLPITEDMREKAALSIVGPAMHFCPWTALLQGVNLHAVRLSLLQAIRPHLRNGARAASAAITLISRFHLHDPLLAPCYKMARMIGNQWQQMAPLVRKLWLGSYRPIGLASSFVAVLKQLDLSLSNSFITAVNGEIANIDAGKNERRRDHALRIILRVAELAKRAGHRREFSDCALVPIDWDGTLGWHRKMAAGVTRQSLEIALTGAMLTPSRISRKKNEEALCPICETEVDDDAHRIVQCSRWASSRILCEEAPIPQLDCTLLAGIFPLGHTCCTAQIRHWQSHLLRIAYDTNIGDRTKQTDPSSVAQQPQAAAAVRRRIRTKSSPSSPSHSLKSSGQVQQYKDANGKARLRCLRCLLTSDVKYEVRFRKKHLTCGSSLKMPAVQLTLPSHIVLRKKCVLGEESVRFVLSCKHCLGAGSALNVRRFVDTHSNCGITSSAVVGRPMRTGRMEKRALDKVYASSVDAGQKYLYKQARDLLLR